MMNIKNHISKFKYLFLAMAVLSLTACDELVQRYLNSSGYDFLNTYLEKEDKSMEVIDVNFSPDYKSFTVSTKMRAEGPAYQLEDSTKVRTEVVESIDKIRRTHLSTPQLVKMRNVEAEGVAENDVRLLALVDLSMPQTELNKVRTYISEIRTVFVNDNLFVAFMDGTSVSKTMRVTDYILDAYFKHSEKPYIYLYRSMQNKREEMMHGRDFWKGAKKLVMITFSDDIVYNDDSDAPIDPEHYRFEELLVRKERHADPNFLAYYVSLNDVPESDEEHEQNVPWLFCTNNGGAYMKDFSWTSVKRRIYDAFRFDFPDNEFTFVNPDFKVYRGDDKELTLNFYDKQTNEKVASFTTNVSMGEIYKPLIVHGHSVYYVLSQGIMLTLYLLLLVYVIMQFVVPAIRYLIFRHRYVISYAGSNMSYQGKAVAQTCYFCKAPFVPGDKIVVKCEHSMHESCWEENEYHCPEYPDRCKQGSHYFNKENIFDTRNASYYMKWILMAIICAFLAWFGFSFYMHWHFDGGWMHRLVRPPVTQLPFMGGVSGFFLTVGLATFAVSCRGWRRWLQVLIRAVIAAVICYISFLLINVLILAFDIQRGITIINGIPWIASSFVIALCATYGTRIVYRTRLLLLTILLGIFSMAIWIVFYQLAELDFRVLLLLSFVIYGVGMAVSMATASPRSERYFLTVQGAVKQMDVALYKWFKNNLDRVVTIGKSVDCSLQLSWDVQSNIAPVQAEIRMMHKTPYLIALEPGVFVEGKPLKVDRKIRLYHGKSFSIGQTSFTYIEKDR